MEGSTPARSRGEDWLDAFIKDAQQAAKDIERRAQRNNEIALQQLSEEFDADIEARRRKEEAIARRDITLKKAWLAQEALKANNIPTDDWMDYLPNFELKGSFSYKIYYKERVASLAFSGWALDRFGTFMITTDRDSPLAIVERSYPRNDVLDKHNIKLYKKAMRDEQIRHRNMTMKPEGWFNLCAVENNLITINSSDIDEDNENIGNARKAYFDFEDGDFDKKIQGKIANLVAEKVINPEKKRIMGRSF